MIDSSVFLLVLFIYWKTSDFIKVEFTLLLRGCKYYKGVSRFLISNRFGHIFFSALCDILNYSSQKTDWKICLIFNLIIAKLLVSQLYTRYTYFKHIFYWLFYYYFFRHIFIFVCLPLAFSLFSQIKIY